MRPFATGFISELVKLGFHETAAPGGQWTISETVNDTEPVIHKQSIPGDVTLKTDRADHYARNRQRNESGRIQPGQLGEVGQG